MSKPQLKPLADQVIVITGASSGIGLITARQAAAAGAKLVLCARSEKTLNDVVSQINATGPGKATAVVADVSKYDQLQRVADVAVSSYGRVDTWINNAGLGMWGRLDQTNVDDARRLFDINFFGIVNGSQIALPLLKKNQGGGALINLGSEVSDDYPVIQGMYAASKHAVKGFTDALRVETNDLDKAPISITLIQPQAVDTPFAQHAKNYTDKEAKLPSPMISAEKVADSILKAAVTPTREDKVGAISVISTTLSKLLPSVADKFSSGQAERQHYDEKPRNPQGILHVACETYGTAGQTKSDGGVQSA